MSNVISSRTPEGSPNHCPICDADVRIEPSMPFGDAPCPNCGTLLWFLFRVGEPHFWVRDDEIPIRERLVDLLAMTYSLDRESITFDDITQLSYEISSLDAVELVMELELGDDLD